MNAAQRRGSQDLHGLGLQEILGCFGHAYAHDLFRQHAGFDHDHLSGFQAGQTASAPEKLFDREGQDIAYAVHF
jgi:hypothetical protein